MIQPWITVADILEGDDPSAAWAVDAAIWILYKLSGEKYAGIQEVTEVYSSYTDNYSGLPTVPVISEGQILHRHSKHVTGSKRLQLKNTPVRSVESVKIGGKVVDPSRYQLRGNKYLVRTDGQVWTSSPNRELEVSYTFGVNPPAMGIAAAIRLANELVWADQQSENCTLPERISSSVTRQGVSYTILDPQEFLDKGRTGITIVDMFINTSNPSRAKKRPRVFSPTSLRAERIN